jgi:hypothetical protein
MAIRGGDPSMWNCETVVRAPKMSRPLRAPRGAPRPRLREPMPPDDEAETVVLQKAYRPHVSRGPSRGPLSAVATAAPAPSLFFEESDPVRTPDPIPPSVRPVIWLFTAVFLVVIGYRAVPAAVDRVTAVTTLLEVR